MGASGSSSSTTTVKKLPEYATPYVLAYLQRSYNYYLTAYVPYWNTVGALPTIAPQPANETAGIAALAARGRSGNLTITKGLAYVTDVIDGNFLPGTDSAFVVTREKIHDKPAGTFVSEVLPLLGRSAYAVGDLSQENVAQTLLAGSVTKISARKDAAVLFQNFKLERKRQVDVLSYGIEYAGQPYKDADTLRAAGLYQREYDQSVVENNFRKWLDEQMGPLQRHEVLGNAIRTLVGTQHTKTTPMYKPPMIQAVAGGAMTGASIGGYFGGYGAGIGAVFGALYGYASASS